MADNEVEIVVSGRDTTDAMWASARRRADVESKAIVATVKKNFSEIERMLAAIGDRAGAELSDGVTDSLRDTDDDARRAGVDVGEAFSDGVEKGIDGIDSHVRKSSEQAGKSGGDGVRRGLLSKAAGAASGFASKLTSSLGSALGDHKLAAAIVPAIAAVGPLAGAALSATLVAGLSTGVIGGGVALAFKDPTVKAEASALGEFVGERLSEAAKPFIPATRQALAIFRNDWSRVDGDIRATFDAAAAQTPKLAQGLSDTLAALIPGIKDAVEGFEPIANVISNELPKVGTALSDMFSNMGEDAEDSATALAAVFGLITDSIEMINTAVTGLTKAWGGSLDMIQQAAEATPDWNPFAAGARWASDKIDELRDSAEGAGSTLHDLSPALDESASAAEAMGARAEIMAGTMVEAVDAAGSLADALDVLNGGTLDARKSARNYQKAIDNVSKALKENGKTLNINTAKGRENQESLDNLATSVSQHMNNVYAQTEATKGSAAAQRAANAVYANGRAQLIAQARAFGMTKAQAEAYANSVLGIPKNWKTNIQTNAAQARDQAREAGRAVRSIPTRWQTVIEVRELHREASRAHGGVVGAAATGGVRSNRVLVGEAGPEVVDLAPGSTVHSNPDTRRMMAGAVGGGDGERLEVRARFDPTVGSALQRAVGEALRLEVWRSGGIDGTGGSRWSPRRA